MPPAPLTEADRRAIELLREVRLITFTASPTAVGPFGFSTLDWEVEAAPAIQLALNINNVPHRGSKVIYPNDPRSYRLTASIREFSSEIGSITIPIDLGSCDNLEVSNIEPVLMIGVENKVRDDEELKDYYFPSVETMDEFGNRTMTKIRPIIKVTDGNIFFDIELRKKQSFFPDATIHLSADMSVGVTPGIRGKLVPKSSVKKGYSSVTVPWWAWGIPLAVPLLIVRLSSGRREAVQRTKSTAQTFAEEIGNLIELANTILPGKELQELDVKEYQNNGGLGVARYCIRRTTF